MPNFPELSKAKGIMRQHKIFYKDISQATGRSVSGICKIMNGDVEIGLEFQKQLRTIINEKSGATYSMDDLYM